MTDTPPNSPVHRTRPPLRRRPRSLSPNHDRSRAVSHLRSTTTQLVVKEPVFVDFYDWSIPPSILSSQHRVYASRPPLFGRLPAGVQSELFSYLYIQEWNTMRRTSQEMKTACDRPDSRIANCHGVRWWLTRPRGLLTAIRENSGLSAVMRRARPWTELDLSHWTFEHPDEMTELVHILGTDRGLRSLTLNVMIKPDEKTQAANWPLNMDWIQRLTSLTELDIERFSNPWTSHECLTQLTNLTKLTLHFSGEVPMRHNRLLGILSEMVHLRHLVLSSFEHNYQLGDQLLQPMTFLETLDVRNVTSGAVKSRGFSAVLSHLESHGVQVIRPLWLTS